MTNNFKKGLFIKIDILRSSLILILIIFSLSGFSQVINQTDSIDVRVFNQSKHYLKLYSIRIDGKDYIFSDIRTKKYSDYQKLPYLWPSNSSKTIVIIKKYFDYDQWMTLLSTPIDHVGERIINKGKYTIFVNARKKKDNLIVDEIVKKE